ncbi:hypothetical protein NQ314_008052 [Rhamnusium bicolor]|uniref:Uncharacterized protein n=1 Tax=Rhamnusium bicolor TaxID=1586634 RepID=A0AAV8YHR6_9CUCU|nr:hypothetical protein NQ314_008052 [Rhamnusium bicolor]
MHVEVQKILAHPKGSKQRNHMLTLLRKKGNYLNDPEEGKPVRNGTESTSYLPCIHCLGFYSSRNLWRHRKQCLENPNTAKPMAGTKASAQNFQLNYLKVDPDLRERVFPRMRADKISLVAKKDPLICAFGAGYLKTHREKHFLSVTSRKMREVSRLLLEIRKLAPTVKKPF